MLYDIDVVSEDAINAWASEKQYADESDKVFLKQSEKFIQVWSFSKCLLQY
jgi:translation initiation factor eIF-2B subunit epsilon